MTFGAGHKSANPVGVSAKKQFVQKRRTNAVENMAGQAYIKGRFWNAKNGHLAAFFAVVNNLRTKMNMLSS
jgi:hypothetical protein